MNVKSVIHSPGEKFPSWYTPITEDMLQEMTRRIVEEFQPEKIILFGSYAYGQPAFHSDVDLLVVTNRYRRKSIFARDWLVARVARPPGVAMDVIVRTPAEVAYRLKIGDRFFREVMTKGLVLYERSQPRRRMGAPVGCEKPKAILKPRYFAQKEDTRTAISAMKKVRQFVRNKLALK